MQVTVSILIKALNEEAEIGRCLESAIKSVARLEGEIILIDSLSTDRTVDIAKNYQVRIIQFKNHADIGCGAAVQLGYQYAKGEYIYVLDGDMELIPEFLESAVKFLENHVNVAGIGGKLIDKSIMTIADKRRKIQYLSVNEKLHVDHLGGGGLYRRKAIDSVGYLGNRWLKAGEELELGLRLRSAGWQLVRVPENAVLHRGHTESTLEMLHRLRRNGRMSAYGLLLRYAVGTPWFIKALRKLWFVYVVLGIYLFAMAVSLLLGHILALPFWHSLFAVLAATISFVVLASSVKHSSFSSGLLGFVAWHLYFFAAAGWLFAKPKSPFDPIPAVSIS